MIELPDPSRAFAHENDFYLSCDVTRIARLLAQYEWFKMTRDLPGAIVECGVFKGASLIRLASYLKVLGDGSGTDKRVVGFDAFGRFPETSFAADQAPRQGFIEEAGEEGIGVDQLREVLERKGLSELVELVAGDVCDTVPRYVEQHPDLRISLLNLDTDIYEPAVVVLEHLYPRLVAGGVLIIDNYGSFPGETQAVDEYFRGTDVEIRRLAWFAKPAYVVKRAVVTESSRGPGSLPK